MTFHPRTEWQSPAQRVTGPELIWPKITGWVIHYTAVDNLPTGDPGESQAQIPQWLRNSQNAYLHKADPYSLGYNEMHDWLGDVWEIRGETIKPAATLNHNDQYAFLLYVDGQDAATEAQCNSVAARILELERRHFNGRQLPIRGHRDFAPTGCPGEGVYAQIKAGRFRQLAAPEQPVSPHPSIDAQEPDDMPFLIKQDNDPAVYAVIPVPTLPRKRARVHITAPQFDEWNAACGPICTVANVADFGNVVGS